jgi:AcrR family transcriptional regulator
MAKKTQKKPVRRKLLSREKVLSAALKMVDEGGIESLSMRNLAQTLKVEAMSLYNHVSNKEAILDGLVELVGSGQRREARRGR